MNGKRKYRRGSVRMHVVPLLVWLAAVALVIVLFRAQAERLEVFGVALGQVREISSTSPGRLLNVPVQLFQPVSEGDPVAIVDTVLDHKHLTEELEAKRRVMVAEIDRLRAELEATADQMEAQAAAKEDDLVVEQRRFAVDVENARLRVLELKAQVESDQVALEQLQLDKKIYMVQGQLQQAGATPLELQKTEVAYKALLKQAEDNQYLLHQAEQDLKYAEKRLADYAQRVPRNPSVDLALDVIRKQIAVQEEAIRELLQDRMALVIECPFDGVVSAIQRSPGEAILPGEPILTISETLPREVVAYVNRSEVSRIRANMRVELIKDGVRVESQVTHLGPDVQLMPEALRLSPEVPQWGRPVLIAIPHTNPDFRLIPGELVQIRVL